MYKILLCRLCESDDWVKLEKPNKAMQDLRFISKEQCTPINCSRGPVLIEENIKKCFGDFLNDLSLIYRKRCLAEM